MAVYRWSTLVNGRTITPFNRTSDQLQFDQATISAADVTVTASGNNTIFSYGGKSITVAMPFFGITTGNVDFVNDSMLAVGDGLASTAFDNSGGELGTGTGNDQLIAGGGGYALHAGAGIDVLKGGSGDDDLDGGTGNDRMSGGASDDVYHVDSTADVVIESANQGDDHVISSATFTLGANVETLQLIGTAAIGGTGNVLANIITGNDAANALVGNGGNDDLTGEGGNDRLYGGDGADVLDGGGGFDYAYYINSKIGIRIDMSGNEGSTGEAMGDSWGSIEGIVGSQFNDRILGDSANNVLQGRDGSDQLIGNLGNDRLEGGNGEDFLNGELGADDLFGGAGNDTFYFDTEQASGDVVVDFNGNGAAAGDQLVFHGYGTAADGATFIQLDTTHWEITSSGGTLQEIIRFSNAPTIDASDYTFI